MVARCGGMQAYFRRTLCISIRGSQVVFSGEENCVLMASENLENMTISELAEAMKGIVDDSDGLSYKTSDFQQ